MQCTSLIEFGCTYEEEPYVESDLEAENGQLLPRSVDPLLQVLPPVPTEKAPEISFLR